MLVFWVCEDVWVGVGSWEEGGYVAGAAVRYDDAWKRRREVR